MVYSHWYIIHLFQCSCQSRNVDCISITILLCATALFLFILLNADHIALILHVILSVVGFSPLILEGFFNVFVLHHCSISSFYYKRLFLFRFYTFFLLLILLPFYTCLQRTYAVFCLYRLFVESAIFCLLALHSNVL